MWNVDGGRAAECGIGDGWMEVRLGSCDATRVPKYPSQRARGAVDVNRHLCGWAELAVSAVRCDRRLAPAAIAPDPAGTTLWPGI